MSTAVYVSDLNVAIGERRETSGSREKTGTKTLFSRNLKVCFFEEENDSTESLHLRRIESKKIMLAAINCFFKGASTALPKRDLPLKPGDPKSVLNWYLGMEKDEEYADKVDEAIKRTRNMRLH